MNNNTKKILFFSTGLVCAILAVVLLLRLSGIAAEIENENIYNFRVNLGSLSMFSMMLYGLIAVSVILAVITLILTYIDKPGCIKAVRVFKLIILIFILIVAIITLVAFVMDISKIDNTDRTLETVEEVFNYTTIFTKFTNACQYLYNTFVIVLLANAFSYFAAIEKYSTVVDVDKVMKEHKKKEVQKNQEAPTKQEIDAKLSSLGLKPTTAQTGVAQPKTSEKTTEVKPNVQMKSANVKPAEINKVSATKPTLETKPVEKPKVEADKTTVQPKTAEVKTITPVQKEEAKPTTGPAKPAVAPVKPNVAPSQPPKQMPAQPPRPMPPKMPPKAPNQDGNK